MPRIDELDSNQYELYKKTDQLPEELAEDNEFNEIEESNLDEVFEEYRKLENENILNIKKTKFQSIARKLSQELEKINKYPVPVIDSEIENYEASQVCMFITAIIYFILMFYFRSIFVLLIIPLMLYIFNKFNLI
jgi:hypothetical protein